MGGGHTVVDISGNSEFIATAPGSFNLSVFANQGTEFVLHYTGPLSSPVTGLDITDDGKWIALTLLNSVIVCFYDTLRNSFIRYNPLNCGLFSAEEVAISEDHQWVVASFSFGIEIYHFDNI